MGHVEPGSSSWFSPVSRPQERSKKNGTRLAGLAWRARRQRARPNVPNPTTARWKKKDLGETAAWPRLELPCPRSTLPCLPHFSGCSTWNVKMAASSPSLPPPPPPTATLAGNLTASSILSTPPPRPRLAAAHRRAVVAASASSRPPPPPPSPQEDGEEQEVERAMGMDGGIPGTSGEFLRRVSSRAYGMRRHLMESLDSLAYDVVESNPWREGSKPVYVLARSDNLLWTMKTRRSRGEVERELGMLFSKGGGSAIGTKSKYSDSKFNMLVEDIRDGVLVFEDEDDAVRYCDLLEVGGQGCEGIAEIEASSVFNMCRSMKALAVLFRRGSTPPLPRSLERDLRARKRSLED